MPPVLGPWSPSKARLWSWAEARASACLPSHRAKKLISSPSKKSSTTTAAPAWPNPPPSIMSMAPLASARVAATTTPLPAAEGDDGLMVGAIETGADRIFLHARVARRGIEPVAQRTCRNRPGQRVFAPAGPDEKDVHAPAAEKCRRAELCPNGAGLATR